MIKSPLDKVVLPIPLAPVTKIKSFIFISPYISIYQQNDYKKNIKKAAFDKNIKSGFTIHAYWLPPNSSGIFIKSCFL